MSAPIGITATVVRPAVAWLNPAPNSTSFNGSPLTLQAGATYAAGTIAKVEFLDGATLNGQPLRPQLVGFAGFWR